MLVAIAIPVFTSQLEKSRDSVSVSNLRAAYAEATSAVLTSNGKASTAGRATTKDAASGKQEVTVTGVALKGQVTGWSDMEKGLPFTGLDSAGNDGGTPADNASVTFEITLDTGACVIKSIS